MGLLSRLSKAQRRQIFGNFVLNWMPRLRRAKALAREFAQIGLKAATQSYTLNTSTDSKSGVNTYAVFYAPRSDGTEALVLSAPWISRDKIRSSHMSKDIIFVVSDGDTEGLQAWLKAYHGNEQNTYERSEEALKIRSGAIQAALNLDFAGTGDYNALGIFFEGVNGQLPNLDMINSVADIAATVAPVELTLHDELVPVTENVTKNYINSLKRMLYMMKYQAVGTPTGNHGLYLKYKIDAITLYGFDKPGWHSQRYGLFRIGCLLESSIRSLNNLLEHLHQSFFFYLLSGVRRYTSIGLYMPPVIILGVSFIFHALSLWGLSSDLPLELEAMARNKNAAVSLPYARRARSVKVPATVVGLSFIAGLASFKLLTTQFGFPGETPLLKLVASAGVCSMLVLSAVSSAQVRHRILKMQAADKTKDAKGTPNNKQDPELAPAPDWITLKTFVLALSALVVTTLSALNFSLAVSIGIVIVWPYLHFRPSRLMLLNVIQTVILVGISPPGLVLFASWWYSMDVSLVLGWILEGYEILGTWLLPTICCIYWPINLAATVMVLLPVS
ncbi:Glycosyl phosphatidyl inositol protein transamidase complex subunit [Podila minutissima]|uniref:Glycosyl phosphatidyl inositol protein transamidase complex subunit n=1 Tax=Podila minutissima TaxID=64525 RepID=A0A9P5SWB0_9FUNG|nr:Glycosyl phosphatidyl inositol protein transamidase complex subunit [Podila minutissima]